MKKIFLVAAILMLWASPLLAEQAPEDRNSETTMLEVPLEGRIGFGWYGIEQSGNTIAGEYRYFKSSPAAILDLEWDPLPHRFVLESYFLNPKDYFGEADYSYRDVVLLNAYTRGLFHNLHHYRFGPDDPGGFQFTDLNPADLYGIDNQLGRGFLRLKTPDFPLHLFADVRTISREGTIQQRFFRESALTKLSQSRAIDWNSVEYRVGVNSHLGPLEAEYYHTEKKFEAQGEKWLTDRVAGVGIPHNRVPDLTSSSDTIKVHTSYSGRLVIAGTYTDGDRKNEDSLANVKFTNSAGDIMFMPVTSVIFSLRYRHYELDAANPDVAERVTLTGLETIRVRDSISSERDLVSGVLRFRATDRLTVKGEVISDNTDRTNGIGSDIVRTNLSSPPDAPAFWAVPKSTTKNTAKIGFNYRVMKKMTLRADGSITRIDNPAYEIEVDKRTSARVALSWMPVPRFNTMLSYGIVREDGRRGGLDAPLASGERDASRDQALASATVLINRVSSLTASYALYKNNVEQTITLRDAIGAFQIEPDVPYDDVAHVGSLSLTVAPVERLNLVASASRSYSRGKFRLAGAGSVTSVSGIADLSDMKVIDTVYAAGIDMDLTESVNSEIRYEHREYDDKIDEAQDGTMKSILATLSLKW